MLPTRIQTEDRLSRPVCSGRGGAAHGCKIEDRDVILILFCWIFSEVRLFLWHWRPQESLSVRWEERSQEFAGGGAGR